MKSILIKDHQEYMLINDERFVIATANASMLKVTDKMKLSKENCDEIFKTFSIEEIAVDRASHFGGVYRNPEGFSDEQIGYLHGFIEGAKLNKDKLFTLEEVHKLIRLVHILPNHELEEFEDENNKLNIDEFITNYLKPNEIEVEIEMEKYGYCEGCIQAGMWHCAHADTCGNAVELERPKLDNAGCLILHRV